MANYLNCKKGIFLRRPNRFIAEVEIDGKTETVHVKNTGRMKELFLPGAEVVCDFVDSKTRKTKYDLIFVNKDGNWFNVDSQVPNLVVFEGLKQGKVKGIPSPDLLKESTAIPIPASTSMEKQDRSVFLWKSKV